MIDEIPELPTTHRILQMFDRDFHNQTLDVVSKQIVKVLLGTGEFVGKEWCVIEERADWPDRTRNFRIDPSNEHKGTLVITIIRKITIYKHDWLLKLSPLDYFIIMV